jgi:hypothetical protein
MRGTTRTSRIAAYVASGALAFSGLTLVAAPAEAAPDPLPAANGAAWLAGQLTDGLFGGTCSFDCGNNIDAGLSLREVGGQDAALAEMKDALPPLVEGYITGEAFGDGGSTYAGATAKSLVFAEETGLDSSSYGGVDLVQRLEDQVTAAGPSAGRIFDTSTFGDFANTLGQSLAVSGLGSAGSGELADTTSFLLQQQCGAGYFRLDFTKDETAADQSCEGGRATGGSAPDTDVTALAVLSLVDQEDTSARVARALGRAESWLVSTQKADGSFGGGPTTEASNANSTGVAGRALAALGRSGPAEDAAVSVRRLQAAELAQCPTSLSSETGAIALNATELAAGRTQGIPQAKRDQWRRASAQALPVLQYAPDAAPAPQLTGPTGYVKSRSKQRYSVGGVVPGDTVCLTGAAARVPASAGLGGVAALTATIPDGTANRTFTVTDRDGTTDTATARVLGAKSLVISKSKARVQRSGFVTATVYGLAPGEAARLSYRGRLVKAGTANAAGRFAATFRVGRQLGQSTIAATGQFGDIRRGSTTVKVVR